MNNKYPLPPQCLDKNCIYLFHDKAGRILQFLNFPRSHILPLQEELEESGSLAAYFSFDNPAVENDVALYLQKNPFRNRPNSGDFFSVLPFCYLLSSKTAENKFFGNISFFQILPDIYVNRQNIPLFFDVRNDTLLGFNSTFHRLFEDKYPDPGTMLNLPLDRFLSPSPGEFQDRADPSFSPANTDGFEMFHSKDFEKEGLGAAEEMPFATGTVKTKEGLRWINSRKEQLFITFLKPMDTRASDFIITLRFENIKGEGPYFILGERYQAPNKLPDDYGYMIGRGAQGQPVMIKHHGFTAVSAPDPGLKNGMTVYHLCKIGESLLLFEGETKLIAYTDFEFIHHREGFISLGLRSGCSCILKGLSIRTRKPAALPGGRLITKLNNSSNRYFTLERFYTNTLTHRLFQNVGAFFLNDVTVMQNQISHLDLQHRAQLKREQKLKEELSRLKEPETLVGACKATSEIKDTAKHVALSDATVLIEGPTGSGKEVLARFIHLNSTRREGPFIKVDCALIPPSLIESHLFGYEKGAFTGAASRTLGLLERADKGTLFLDEIGNLTLENQAKLLQFLNDFTITRVGGTETLALDVRCIAASNRNLEGLIREGAFREDLYYRLNVVHLVLPPLAKRQEDIPALCSHFLKVFNGENRKNVKGFSREARIKLEQYAWPGNIRELKNAIQRAVVFCAGEYITPDLIPLSGDVIAQAETGRKQPLYSLSRTGKEYVFALLKKHGGRINRTAGDLGVSRVTLYHYLKKQKINADDFRKGFESRDA